MPKNIDENYLRKLQKAQNEPFKCAAFSGGGAKGAIYSGAHEALVNSGILDGLEALAGSSAGAITAAAISTGISKKYFQKISTETNLKGLLGDGFLTKDGKPLYDLVKTIVSTNISDYLSDANFGGVKELSEKRVNKIQKELNGLEKDINDSGGDSTASESDTKNSEHAKHRIDALTYQLDKLQSALKNNCKQLRDLKEKAEKNESITFKDLEILHIIDPIKFKDLIITATNKGTGELTIFNAKEKPDVEIALACRASASIPLVFEPVDINGTKYVDGGYRDNIPTKYFQDSDMQPKLLESLKQVQDSKKEGRILTLAFGSCEPDNRANIAIYSQKENKSDMNFLMKFLVNVVFKMVSKVKGTFTYTDEDDKTHEELRENALNTVLLDTKDVSTLSFDKAQAKAEYLHEKGNIQTARHFDNFEIGKREENLDLREFALQLHESTQSEGLIETWKDKILGGKEEKLKKRLSYCKSETWKAKKPDYVLEDFIAVAAMTRSGSTTLSNSTNTMSKMIAQLNDPQTSDKVRKHFNKVLDKASDNKTYEKSDFNDLLKKKEQDISRLQKQNTHQK